MKKLSLLLAITVLTARSCFTMDLHHEINKQGLAYNFYRLPQELKRYIVYLSLRLSVGLHYKRTKKIKAESSILSLAYSSNSKTILTGLADGTACLWDIQTGQQLQQYKGHTDWVLSVAFSPDGETILTGSQDHTARLWNTSTGKEIQQFAGHRDWVKSVAFSYDSATILTGSSDKTARLWNARTGQQIKYCTIGEGWIKLVAFSPHSEALFTVLHRPLVNTVCLLNIKTGRELQLFHGHTNEISSIVFSSDGKTALTGSFDKTARFWDSTTGKQLRSFNGHKEHVYSVALSPDSKTALTGSADGTAHLWDTETGEEIQKMKHKSAVCSVACSPDGSSFITGSKDGILCIWKSNEVLSEEEQKKALKVFIDKSLCFMLSS